jgi:hypothetical protein
MCRYKSEESESRVTKARWWRERAWLSRKVVSQCRQVAEVAREKLAQLKLSR